VLAAHLFLRTEWRKLIIVAAMLPFTILKNGIRILTLSLLSVYVDPTFITNSWLHHSGGVFFYLLVPVMLAVMLWWLRRGERKSMGKSKG
jgi:exosortase/archaeosortase family protein